MRIRELHIHIHNEKLDQIMATLQDFQAEFSKINAATTNIAADITRLADQLASGLSEADEATALEELKGIATQLESIAAVTPE